MTTTMKAGASNRGMSTLWAATVRGADGELKLEQFPHPNLRTNTGNDWQAALMSGSANKGETGTATSTTATSLTNTGAAFPTTAIMNGATGGYAGKIVVAGTVWGVILSNTATVLTIDRWVNPNSPFGAAGTTPGGTSSYVILPGAAPAWYMALSSTAITPAAGDTTLSGELTGSGFARTNYTTLTHTGASSSYSLANTFTATGSATINSEALFTASGAAGVGSAATAGLMTFESSEPTPPSLISGDTLAQTVTVNY